MDVGDTSYNHFRRRLFRSAGDQAGVPALFSPLVFLALGLLQALGVISLWWFFWLSATLLLAGMAIIGMLIVRDWRLWPHRARFLAAHEWRSFIGAVTAATPLGDDLAARIDHLPAAAASREAIHQFMERHQFWLYHSYPRSPEGTQQQQAEMQRRQEEFLGRIEGLARAKPGDWRRLLALEPLSSWRLRRLKATATRDFQSKGSPALERDLLNLQCWLAAEAGWSDEAIRERLGSPWLERKFATFAAAESAPAPTMGAAGAEPESPLARRLAAPLQARHHSGCFLLLLYYAVPATPLFLIADRRWVHPPLLWLLAILLFLGAILFPGLSSPYWVQYRRRDLVALLVWYASVLLFPAVALVAVAAALVG